MKKIITFMLVLVMCLSMAGCGGDKDVSGAVSNKKEETNQDDVSGGLEENQNDEANQEVDVNLLIGEAEGNTYENAFLGIGFNLPEGWTFYTQEQINALNNITQDMLEDDITEQIQNANIIYDMYALDQYGNSVNVNLEKLSAIAAVGIDEKTYVEASMEQIPEALGQMGATNIEVKAASAKLDGSEHAALDISCTSNGVNIYEKIICIKEGQYMASVTLATTYENTTDAVLSYFYEVEK